MISNSSKGQALILIAIAMAALIGVTALAVDGGSAYLDRRSAQNAADSAVLAAAFARAKEDPNWKQVAQNRAQQQGLSNDGQSSVVEVYRCDETGASCGPYQGNAEYIQVIITSNKPTFFGRIVGRYQNSNRVQAIARAASATNGALFGGAAVVTTKPTGQTFLLNGSAQLTTVGGSIFVNSSYSMGLFLNGGSKIHMLADDHVTYINGYTVSGTYGKNGNAEVKAGIVSAPQLTLDQNTFSFIPPIPSTPTCSTNGTQTVSGNTITITPGRFTNAIIVNGGQQAIFQTGTYCLQGGLILNGSASMTSSGRVTFVTYNNSITFNGGVSLTIPDIEIYTQNGDWTFNGSNTFTPNRIRFYASGSGHWIVNGGSTISASDAFFYLTSGYIIWNGSSNINLNAPPQGDPFGGLLVYMPYGNTSPVIFNGGSTIRVTGSYIAPWAPMTINGSVSATAINSQFVVYTLTINGCSQFTVNYNVSENVNQPQSPKIELVR